MHEKLAMEGWWEWDPTERRWTMSPRMFEILGVPGAQGAEYPAAGVMSDWSELIHPDDRPGLAVQVRTHLEGRMPWVQADCRVRRADNAWCWVRLRAASVARDDQTRWIGCMVDVDDHRRTQEILGASQQWLDLVLDASGIGFWDWDARQGQRVYFSHGYKQMLGYESDEIEDTWPGGWKNLVHPDDAAQEKRIAVAHMTGRSPYYDAQYRMRHKDGGWRWIHARGRIILRNAAGEPLRWVGVHTDVTEHRLAEEALRQSEERYRLLAEHATDMISTHDVEGVYLYASPACRRLLGYEPQELVGRDAYDFIHPDDIPVVRRSHDQVLHKAVWNSVVYRLRHKDGRYIWFESNCRFVPASEAPYAIVAVSREVAERVRTEQALRESEERYRTVVQRQTEMICRFLPDTTLTFVNEAYARFFGRRAEELVGRPFITLIPEHEHEKVRGHLRAMTPDAPSQTHEHAVFAPDGRIVWQQWTNQAFFDEHGKLVELQAVGRDVTERHAAEEALRTSEHRYRSLVESLEEMILRIRLDRTLTFANAALCRMLNKTPQELLSQPLHFRIHPDDFEHALAAERQIRQPPHRVTVELRVHTADDWRWINWQCLGLLNDRGEVEEVQAVGRDMTRQKQDQAEQRHRLLALAHVARLNTAGTMASNLAHELSQPLTALLNFAHAVRRRIEAGQATPDLVTEALEQIVLQAERAGQIVQGVREFIGRHVPSRQMVSLPSAVDRAVRFIAAEALRNRVHLQVQCCSTPCQVPAEVSQIEQVLVNLLLNAMDAMHDTPGRPRELTLATQKTPRAVEVRVSDTGPGVDEANRERIFEPFFTTKSHGMGLGLSISRSIVEDHGGRMWVEANEQGGATFCFTLPWSNPGPPGAMPENRFLLNSQAD